MSYLLDVGCGYRKRKGCIGIDSMAAPGVDIVADITKGLPFDDNFISGVYTDHFLEHIVIEDVAKVMKEIHRVCKPDSVVQIRVPHFSGFTNFFEYHKTSFRYNSFAEFLEGEEAMFKYPYQFRLVRRRLQLVNRQSPKNHPATKWYFWNHPMEWLVNKFPMFYETSAWRNFFPSWEIIFIMRVIK